VRLFRQVKNVRIKGTHTDTHQGNNINTIPADKSVTSATETCYAYRTVSERAYDYNNNIITVRINLIPLYRYIIHTHGMCLRKKSGPIEHE